jgi:chorismate mutase
MAGDAALIEELAQKALDLNMNGLMIESHFDPATALCDADQQVTPTQLLEILNRLKHRVQTSDDPNFQDILNETRSQIDSIDIQMLELLGQRTQLSNKIGIEKFKRNISVLQLERWEEMQTRRLELAKKLGISESFVKNILQLVHKESIALQTDIMKQLKQEN